MLHRLALQVLLPVHNEEETIEHMILEIYGELSQHVPMEFVISEDGSTDRTKEILLRLKEFFPMKLLMKEKTQGYSRAVTEGMKVMNAPYLLFLDSDGQCDPKDFWKLWDLRDRYDVLVGRRVPRRDSSLRKLLSRSFYFVYQLFFHVPVHDPSCPFVLTHLHVVKRLLPELGAMGQGFWWEFTARAWRQGFSLGEVTVNHRFRVAGETRIYKLGKFFDIGLHHLLALFKIWHETRLKP